MKTFHFPLERVLHWRRMQLELERAAMERLVQSRIELDRALAGLDSNRSSAELSIARAGTMQAREMQTISAYQRRIVREKAALLERKRQLEGAISTQLAKSIEAQRRVRLIERLREKRLNTWTGAMEAEAESFAAEAWLGRWPILKAGDEDSAVRVAPRPRVDETLT